VRHDHELLEVDRVVGVGAAVEHVHHGHREHVGVDAADVAEQRQAELAGRGLGHRERDAEDGVGPETRLGRRAVEVDQGVVDAALVAGVVAGERGGDLAAHVGHRGEHALAAVALAVVAQLRRLEGARGGARGDDGAAFRAAVEPAGHLDGGVAAGVEDFPGAERADGTHGLLLLW